MKRPLLLTCLVLFAAVAWSQSNRGYYRYPAIHGNTVVFTAEGDLWEVNVQGGPARRLTSHPGEETRAAISPDGKTIAFSADYEGPTEVYTMPAAGGLPMRRTFDGDNALVVGWTPDGKVIYATRRYSTVPNFQLATIDTRNHVELIPLNQASQGVYDAAGKTLVFTRLPFQGSQAKRYKGGTAQKLWRFTPGQEAVALTGDYDGTSKDAMWWNGAIYFLSDRDGTMNLWSMDANGKNPKQLTHHQGWDAQTPSLSDGHIAYKLGADLHVYDIASGEDKAVPIELVSDFDHLREHWVKKPIEYATEAHISFDGDRVAIVSRGKVFVAPAAKEGRLVEATAGKPARFRDARVTADGKSLITLSTESGEVEIWKVPSNGVGPSERLTSDGTVLRWEALPSPNGRWVVHQDKDDQLWLLQTETKEQKKIMTAEPSGNSGPAFNNVAWSPDSRWVSFSTESPNTFDRIYLYNVETGSLTPLTSDRYNSENATWSPDGKWLYFISDRAFKSVVGSPWGPRQPDPFFDKTNKIYHVALQKGLRSPFEPPDELHPDKPELDKDKDKAADKEKETAAKDKPAEAAGKDKAADAGKKPEPPKVDIVFDGIANRITEVPVPAGNYAGLTTTGKRLCWLNMDRSERDKSALVCVPIGNKGDKPETIMEGVRAYEMSGDGKKIMVQKEQDLYVLDSGVTEAALKTPKNLADAKIDLKDWMFAVVPTDEFHEMFLDAWRLHRDYFYDRGMHGIDWKAMRDKYAPLVDRVRDRQELSDLIAEMVAELSALHTFVRGGDIRKGPDEVQPATLGARLERDEAAGGYVVKHIYLSDPDRPDRRSPLARAGVDVGEGDVILAVNGRDALSAISIGELLRNRAGKQVLLHVRPAGKQEPRDVVVKPISVSDERDLRYHEWEYTRRIQVDEQSQAQIGYVHLRAMGPNDIAQWAENFYPVFDRQGLIIDVRHNQGGNIDSWILAKLLRKAWFFWQPRVGPASANMQYAFRGHMVVLCDEWTASDGEAFSEGFRRLGLGKLIGTRTWGGEIWLSASNQLADRGIATAAEMGVFGPEGKWLIEGHGVEPDITVDNLPNATFNGKDAQLEAAVSYLKKLIHDKPVLAPEHPAYPHKALPAAAPSKKKPARPPAD